MGLRLWGSGRNGAARLGRDESGAVLVIIALAMTAILGLLSVTVEVGTWYAERRSLQTAADAAAVAGALEIARGTPGRMASAAEAEAARNGSGGDRVAVNNPPLSGALAGRSDAVEAIVTRVQPRLFSAVMQDGPVTITARAVALTRDVGEACVLALDGGAAEAVSGRGNPNVVMPGCMIAANSNAASAISFSGNVSLLAQTLWTAGGMAMSGNVNLQLARAATTHAWPLPDPYANVEAPPVGSCKHTKHKVNESGRLKPGVYCDGLTITGNADVTLEPGEYIINRGDLSVQGNITINCDCGTDEGVAFVFTSTGGADQIGGVDVHGNVSVTLRARSSAAAPLRGILFYQDRNAPTGANVFNGNAALDVTGVMYFPAQSVEWRGNNSTQGAGCVQIVAKTVVFTGNAALGNETCSVLGARPIASSLARLGE
ncbi:MAG TPA: pilus assembly protein TadG-related protein [Azospirillum sp.]|nr:pilus assembly protein TadG-related protein [Azospirillum sp.]